MKKIYTKGIKEQAKGVFKTLTPRDILKEIDKVGRCGACKHYQRYSDNTKKCDYYKSMPQPVQANDKCFIYHNIALGFQSSTSGI